MYTLHMLIIHYIKWYNLAINKRTFGKLTHKCDNRFVGGKAIKIEIIGNYLEEIEAQNLTR